MGLMPREFIALDGAIYFRTRRLRYDQAKRFAVCLQANPRFTDVETVLSQRVRSAANAFVQYRPSNVDRQFEQIDRQQAKRRQKALTEGRCYQWFLDTDGSRPFYWCLSSSGEVYEVDAGSCSCPDYQFRCRKVYDLRCKHILAYEAACERKEIMRLADVYDSLAWRKKHPLPRSTAKPEFATVGGRD